MISLGDKVLSFSTGSVSTATAVAVDWGEVAATLPAPSHAAVVSQ